MAEQVRAPQWQELRSQPYVRQLTTACNSSSSESSARFWGPKAPQINKEIKESIENYTLFHHNGRVSQIYQLTLTFL